MSKRNGSGRGAPPVKLPAKPVNEAFRQAHAHHQAGRLAEAEPLYRAVLSKDRFNDEALHLLGVLLYQTGRAAEGEPLVRQAIERRKRIAPYHDHLGVILRALDRPAEAAEAQARALALEPENPTIQSNLAATLIDLGRPVEALPLLEKALKRQPKFANAWNNLGLARQRTGELEQAAVAYRQAIALEPRSAVYLCNLGSVEHALGQTTQAIETYRRGLAIDGRSAELWSNLGHALTEGAPEDAKRALDQAVTLRPSYADAWHNLGNLAALQRRDDDARVAYERALTSNPVHFRALTDLATLVLRRGEFDTAAGLLWRALKVQPASVDALAYLLPFFGFVGPGAGVDTGAFEAMIADALRRGALPSPLAFGTAEYLLRAHAAWGDVPRAPNAPAPLEALASPTTLEALGVDALLLAVLEAGVCPEIGFEGRLRTMRASLLQAQPTSSTMTLAAAVARNCFIGEFVLDETDAEATAIAGLERRAEADDASITAAEVLSLAMYRPLLDHAVLPHARSLAGSHAPLAGLLRRTVDAPETERALAETLLTLAPIERQTSVAVRAQYEANPYPRWQTLLGTTPRTWDASFRARWPHLGARGLRPARRVLVAGGGTGQEPVRLARMHTELEVHAIDLSRRSLAYAARQAQAFGVAGRVHLAQADLLDLDALGDRLGLFDRVYCSGVLHHLADPMEGLRAVVSRLAPGGIAQIALYSRAARQGINEARAAASQLGLGTSPADVRALRRQVIAHADRAAFKQILGFRDFYSVSECRDLLLHVQEHQFDLTEIATMLRAVGLEFLAFTFDDPRVELKFRAEHGEARLSDLDAWNAFEQAHPDTFKSMYQLLALRPEAAAQAG